MTKLVLVAETVSVYEAKTHLSKLLARVEAGEEIIISRNGRPIAKLSPVPIVDERRARAFGLLKGQIWMAEGWDEFTEDDRKLWYDGPIFPPEP